MGVDYALSTSGVAGPSGGLRNPVGTVWTAIAGPMVLRLRGTILVLKGLGMLSVVLMRSC